jgi:hypothetical protein
MGRPKKIPISTESNLQPPKSKTLFDHINQIRNIKNKKYFDTLSVNDKKSFNHYMICRFLSMDINSIDEVCYLSKVFDKIPSNLFYLLCCEIISPIKFTPYIKSKKLKLNDDLIGFLSKKYDVSKHTADEYCRILLSTEHGKSELKDICSGYGLSDKEINKILKFDE